MNASNQTLDRVPCVTGNNDPEFANHHFSSPLRKKREEVYGWIRQQLFCPGKNVESLTSSPLEQLYFCGVLFPRGYEEEFEEEFENDAVNQDDSRGKSGSATRHRRYQPPSSVGFSFLVGPEFQGTVTCRAVAYTKSEEEKKNEWTRKNMEDGVEILPPPDRQSTEITHPVFKSGDEFRARVFVLWRPHDNGWLVTVSLSNIKPPDFGVWRYRIENDCLFEIELECEASSGHFSEYPISDPTSQTDEEQELALRYRAKRIFGIGHGAAVDWNQNAEGGTLLRIDWVPRFEAPKVTTELQEIDQSVLRLNDLSDRTAEQWPALIEKLGMFVGGYENWTESQVAIANSLPESFDKAADRIVDRQRGCLARMKEGLGLIKDFSSISARAFRYSHEAMLRQMSLKFPDPHWRPFQLAFLLMTIASVSDDEHPDRGLVDLIWFPTGGGKTEAYLGLIAFYIFHRRLRSPHGGAGTSVIMRYTLRLLTMQQFERAGKLIARMEIMRRREPDILGTEPITAGLWVGGSQTPNTFKQAAAVANITGEQWRELLVFTRCPVCDAPLERDSIVSTDKKFDLYCTNKGCDLHLDGGRGRTCLSK